MGDEESQWKDVWNLYDIDRSGKIKKEEFLDCVRVCTRRYPMSKLQEKCKDYGDAVSYETFFDFMMQPYDGPGPEDLEIALKAFDGKESGELTITQIQTLLTTMGDKLDINSVKPILDAMPQNAGKVKISELVTFLTPPVPTAKPDVDELLKDLVREEAAKMNFAEGEPEISDEVNEEFDRRKAQEAEDAEAVNRNPMHSSNSLNALGGDEVNTEGSSTDTGDADE